MGDESSLPAVRSDGSARRPGARLRRPLPRRSCAVALPQSALRPAAGCERVVRLTDSRSTVVRLATRVGWALPTFSYRTNRRARLTWHILQWWAVPTLRISAATTLTT